ncbi:hypothetical protein PCANC_11217 [Puccinia coronata f. sp. avenae]|uniref:Uncharacterized protein n=1 Tax=Puccinia coronata f. sp. avenae TaxID=200324 RepID=A0A2N5SG54_9BASI|nr:hypothetical protein PCASD_18836 [Puccinia coronata f. sp. avenae]PLW19999.1 hypothetical protein PCANC_10191 [Puccinia coronata f. sp. avenae]PLW46339.1 hypothetical protein PCANC_11217 [Puccinia coronata f. sp. avenae]PLW50630.1 hypothetical protein PCASD_00639 [Puccinia coronata f. sp. avenae]
MTTNADGVNPRSVVKNRRLEGGGGLEDVLLLGRSPFQLHLRDPNVRPNQLTTSITMYWSFRHMKYSWDVPHLATLISFEITRRRESSPFSSNPAE